MCLIFLAYKVHPDFPLIVAANRDEFYDRPTEVASVWTEPGGILAGRDMQGKGTWLGVTASGRFAAVTNYRGDKNVVVTNTSRGHLVSSFLNSDKNVENYLATLMASSDVYQGYNLLVYDRTNLAYASNRNSDQPQLLQPGIYGLSNSQLNTPWPKVESGREKLRSMVKKNNTSAEQLIELMMDNCQAVDEQLPETGVPLEWERLLSSSFISSESYGTRCTTVVKYSKDDQIEFVERSHAKGKEESVTNRFKFST